MWMPDVDVPAITAYVQSMAVFPDEMWARAARAISKAFEEHGSPLDAVAALDPPPPTLHLYAQPPAREYLEAQRTVAAERPWFAVEHLGPPHWSRRAGRRFEDASYRCAVLHDGDRVAASVDSCTRPRPQGITANSNPGTESSRILDVDSRLVGVVVTAGPASLFGHTPVGAGRRRVRRPMDGKSAVELGVCGGRGGGIRTRDLPAPKSDWSPSG